MTTALEGVRDQRHAPAALYPHGKDQASIVQEAGYAPRPVWKVAENLAPTGIRSPDHPARSQSLYRLRYPAHFSSFLICQILIPAQYLIYTLISVFLDSKHIVMHSNSVIIISPAYGILSQMSVFCYWCIYLLLMHMFQTRIYYKFSTFDWLVRSTFQITWMNITIINEWKFVNYKINKNSLHFENIPKQIFPLTSIYTDIQFRTKCCVAGYGNKFVSLMV
jgi:hypothetical protein